MTTARRGLIGRRPVLAVLVGLAALAGGLAYELPRLLAPRYKPTPYDDLLAQFGDRETAARLGRAVLAASPRPFDPASAAEALRNGPGKGSLGRAMAADIAQGRLVEVEGWLLPASLAHAAALAAAAQ